MNGPSDERGLLATEAAIIMPIMLLFALLSVFVVHVERHSSRAQQAADAAARAASLQRSDGDARSAAQFAAEAVCNGQVVLDDAVWRFEDPVEASFTPGRVTVGLTCTEQFNAFGRLIGSSSRTESGIAVSAIEYWRSN